ncbi:MAG: TrkH family potassium uptake protein [Proteobacteria bacterium]|nr:TrkH family potassium uptake protein [Pseudomonadota bacterium]
MVIKKFIDDIFSSPPRIILLSYLLIIFLGSVILFLPISTTKPINYLDALFTTVSAITDTGLIVLNTPKDFTPFGKFIILLLIHIGGLGYMTFTTFFLLTFRQKISFKDRLILAESLNYPGAGGLIRFLTRVFLFVIIIEMLGAIILFFGFLRGNNIFSAIKLSIFHSISAFNNAGFSLFPNNLLDYQHNLIVNVTIASLIIIGGLGFFVINDFYLFLRKEVKRISNHSLIACFSSLYLIFFGAMLIIIFEYSNNSGLWKYNWIDRIISALFHSISTRTAGFNTVDLSGFTDATLSIMSALMFVGASPGSTGGGIKTTTITVIFLAIVNYVKGSNTVNFNFRKINVEQVYKALVIFSFSFLYITFVAIFISKLENVTFTRSLFEVISAFSTVGLSVGNGDVLSLSANFTVLGKIIIMATMFIGKIGLISFVIALSKKPKEARIKYPEARILI